MHELISLSFLTTIMTRDKQRFVQLLLKDHQINDILKNTANQVVMNDK